MELHFGLKISRWRLSLAFNREKKAPTQPTPPAAPQAPATGAAVGTHRPPGWTSQGLGFTTPATDRRRRIS